jgi:F-type H+-transporting ATPase subunit gamma
MRKAQERMRSARPYTDKIRTVSAHLAQANPEYTHPFLVKHEKSKKIGIIVITTDKGLCGGLNTNALRIVTNQMKAFEAAGNKIETVCIGNKGLGFMNRIGAKVVAQAVNMGDTPHLEQLIGPVKVLLDSYDDEQLDAVYICYTRFINTMKQEPVFEQLLPLTADKMEPVNGYSWDYLYEPDAKSVIDELLLRYAEALVYQGVVENMASEQSARMVAMKAATDNAGSVIGELKLIYNKTRQAAITKELSEIVAGAAAV